MTFQEVQDALGCEQDKADWVQHRNGGWLHHTVTVDDSAIIYGLVYDYAQVRGDSVVYPLAQVYEYATVQDSTITASARVYGNAMVNHQAKISGDAKVYNSARVSGAEIFGSAQVFEFARVTGDAQVYGNAKIFGSACISGTAKIFGFARVFGNATILGNSLVAGGKWETSPLQIQGSKHFLNVSAPNEIAIGCEIHPIDWWLQNYERVGADNDYSEEQIREYGMYIRLCALKDAVEGVTK